MTTYTVITTEGVQYRGSNITDAIRLWDAFSANVDGPIVGGIQREKVKGRLVVASGWLIHVRDNGSVYVNPSLVEG